MHVTKSILDGCHDKGSAGLHATEALLGWTACSWPYRELEPSVLVFKVKTNAEKVYSDHSISVNLQSEKGQELVVFGVSLLSQIAKFLLLKQKYER